MNAMVGPAMVLPVARSMGLLRRAWSSLVMKMATGPLMPGGMMH